MQCFYSVQYMVWLFGYLSFKHVCNCKCSNAFLKNDGFQYLLKCLGAMRTILSENINNVFVEQSHQNFPIKNPIGKFRGPAMNLKFIFACPSKYFPFPLLQDYSELQADKSLQPAKFLSNQSNLNKFLPPTRATHWSILQRHLWRCSRNM